jgi:hypothetical protein
MGARAAAHRTSVAEAGPGLGSSYGTIEREPRAVYPLAGVEFGRLAGTNSSSWTWHTA